MESHTLWRDMFFLAVPILEKILRPVCVYAFLVISLRLSGKRELVQLNPFDLVVRFLYKHRSLDQLIEGKADVLIEDGKVNTRHLKHELITMAQLEAAARKQGFDSLSEVQQCVLEPGGTISFIGKKPDVDETRHQTTMKRLDELLAEMAKLRAGQPPLQA